MLSRRLLSRQDASVHVGYVLNQLSKSRVRDASKWLDVLNRTKDDPTVVGVSTGKEVALTLNGLIHCPDYVVSNPIFPRMASEFSAKAVASLAFTMNEKSIAIASMALMRLQLHVDVSVIHAFVDVLCSIFDQSGGRRIKFPQNIAQVAYALAQFDCVPIGTRAKALNTWIKGDVLVCIEDFHVKDIVQVATAYSHCHVRNEDILSALEEATWKQLQYMDSVSLSAIAVAMAKLSYTPSEGLIAAILSTVSQCSAQLNSQSFCSLVYSVSVWVSNQAAVDAHQLRAILCEFNRLIETVPANSLVVLLKALAQLHGDLPDCDWSGVQSTLVGKRDWLISVCTDQRDWIVADIATSLHQLGSAVSSPFIDALVVPMLTSMRQLPPATAVKMISALCASSPSSLHIAIVLERIDRLIASGDVRVMVPLIIALSGSHADVHQVIQTAIDALLAIPRWDSEVSTETLLTLARVSWTISGLVDDRISAVARDRSVDSDAHRDLVAWMDSPPLIPPPGSVVVSLSDVHINLVPTEGLMPPPPGTPGVSLAQSGDAQRLVRLIESIDSSFFVNCPGMQFHFSEGPRPSFTEIATATQQLCYSGIGGTAVLIPSSSAVNEDLAYTVLTRFITSSC